MRPVLDRLPEGPVGLALSGGGDSMALMVLASEWARTVGRELRAATVDHGLRDGSAAEAALAGAAARQLGLDHTVLAWEGWSGQGNLQDAARQARYRLLSDWATSHGLVAVLLGHTLDDQAETFLMRLARGSGVDGLSAMATLREEGGMLWARPLLTTRRADLRELLTARGTQWVEDPSNADLRFDRIKIREAMPALQKIGLWPERLAATADRLSLARDALQWLAADVAHRAARAEAAGYLQIAPDALVDAPQETRLRLLAAGLNWVTGQHYRPRLAALKPVAEGILTPEFAAQTLHGALVIRKRGQVILCREPARVGPAVPVGAVWDGRWRTGGPEGLRVMALGEAGLAQITDWRDLGLPREVLLTLPAIFDDEALIAAPFAKPDKECHFDLLNGPDAFFGGLSER